MNKKQHPIDDTINLLDILKYTLKYKKIVILTTILGLIAGIVFSVAAFMRGEMSKKYQIKTSIAVSSQTSDGLFASQSINPNSTDIHLAEDMVDSVIFVIKSDRTLEKAVDELELIGITAKDIYDNLELAQYNKTQIIDLTLYWRNAEEGIRILEAINDVAPKILVDILKIGDVRVVNDPTSKYLIGGSIKASIWIMMTLVGLAVGMGIVILLMFFRPTLINVSDAESKLDLLLMGDIPADKHYQGKCFMDGNVLPLSHEVKDGYMSSAHVLDQVAKKGDYHILYVTSTREKEGCTSVVANLGIQLAEMEKRVLLVDLNHTSPNLGAMFLKHVDHDHSLNALYDGDVMIEDAINQITGYLHVLPLLHEQKGFVLNDEILAVLKNKAREYDIVLIDTAPVGDYANVLRINQIADGAIFVIRYDHSTMAEIDEALTRLKKTDIPVLGCVVDQTKELPF